MQKIAGNLTIEDWCVLEKTLDDAKPENWGNAYDFFERRISTRYLSPISTILRLGINRGEGFSVVSLQCSMIEMLQCFYKGWISKNNKFFEIDGVTPASINNSDIFISFFNEREPFKSMGIKGSDFYYDVRCALLHEIQTKNGWLIRTKGTVPYSNNGKEKIIYRENFQFALEELIGNYKIEILSDAASSLDLRRNFRGKFNHICKISQ